jgi:hypothetical protein
LFARLMVWNANSSQGALTLELRKAFSGTGRNWHFGK